jgi:hypothetical protein
MLPLAWLPFTVNPISLVGVIVKKAVAPPAHLEKVQVGSVPHQLSNRSPPVHGLAIIDGKGMTKSVLAKRQSHGE